MSPSEVDLAPELTKQILDAVDQGFEQQLTFTQQMMALDSTRGNEHQAQACFFEALDFRGYEMDQWSIDVAQIESHPGFSPSRSTTTMRSMWSVRIRLRKLKAGP